MVASRRPAAPPGPVERADNEPPHDAKAPERPPSSGLARVPRLLRIVLQYLVIPSAVAVAVDFQFSILLFRIYDWYATVCLGDTPPRAGPVGRSHTLVRESELPLRTSGSWIVNQQGQRVRLRCVNWYGANLKTYTMGGLHRRAIGDIVEDIVGWGFNCVRLPYSLEMHLTDVVPDPKWLSANPDLQHKPARDVYYAVVEAVTAAKLMVFINNHHGKAMMCCSVHDGEGFWYSDGYPEESWLRSLTQLAERYSGNPYVVGHDLRNELRAVTSALHGTRSPMWGVGGHDYDWAAAATRAALAVAARDKDALLVIEGLNFDTDLSGLGDPRVLDLARPHLNPELLGRVVYEAHDYSWTHAEFCVAWCLHWFCLGQILVLVLELRRQHGDWKWRVQHFLHKLRGQRRLARLLLVASVWTYSFWLASYARFEQNVMERWGFLLRDGVAPLWLGEFGISAIGYVDLKKGELGKWAWYRHLSRFISENHMDYAIWAINGDQGGDDETFGLYDYDYASLRHPWLVSYLH